MPSTTNQGKRTTKPGTTTSKPIRTFMASRMKRTQPGLSFQFRSDHGYNKLDVVATSTGTTHKPQTWPQLPDITGKTQALVIQL